MFMPNKYRTNTEHSQVKRMLPMHTMRTRSFVFSDNGLRQNLSLI